MEVGRSLVRVDAADKVTGRAKYTDDLCPRPVLEAAILQRHPPKEPKWTEPPSSTAVEADLWPDRDPAVELDAARGLQELRRRQEDAT